MGVQLKMGHQLTVPIVREVSPGRTWGFYRGKATRALAETQVVNETGIMRDTTPLEVAHAAVLIVEQFLCVLRW